MRAASTGPQHAVGLCLPPLPDYHSSETDPDFLAYCRKVGDRVVVLSPQEMRCLVIWFREWHPDTFELALRDISDQRRDRGDGPC